MSGCGSTGLPSVNGVPGGTAGGGASGAWSLVRELDFSAEPTTNLADGQYVMATGESLTVINSANATTWRMLNGSGLQVADSTANSQWNTAGGAQNAPAVYLSLNNATLAAARNAIQDYDVNRQYLYQIRITSNSANAATEGVVLSIWQPAANQYAGSAIAIAGGWHGSNVTITPALGVGMMANTATPVLVETTPAVNPGYGDFDVIGISNSPSQPSVLQASAGLYTGGDWPTMDTLRECGYCATTATPAALTAVRFNDPTARIVISFPQGNTSGTMAAIVERMRILERMPIAA